MKEDLEKLPSKKRRLGGAGRKAAFPSMEEELIAWIEDLRSNNLQVTRSSIKKKAIELVQGNETDFGASRGWLERFMERHNLSLRRRTTVSQRLPQDLEPKIIQFIISTRQLRVHKKYPLEFFGNKDETPLWLDMPGNTTVTHTGRSVPIRTTGHDKGRFTVVLVAMANGRKLNPYVVFKGVRCCPELSKVNGVIVAYSRNGWMNEELTKDWVKRGWGTLNSGRRLLVWDAYKCHLMSSVRDVVDQQANSDLSIIPGGLTSLLQPADVSWNKPFKSAYRGELYNAWMIKWRENVHCSWECSCSRENACLKWVKQARQSVSAEVVLNSFQCCGVSVSIDGSEDSKIHCLKGDLVPPSVQADISRKTAALFKPQDVEEDTEDPFAGIEEDESEEEGNEIKIVD